MVDERAEKFGLRRPLFNEGDEVGIHLSGSLGGKRREQECQGALFKHNRYIAAHCAYRVNKKLSVRDKSDIGGFGNCLMCRLSDICYLRGKTGPPNNKRRISDAPL